MPVPQDWIIDPLTVVDQIYDQCEGREEWITKTEKFFEEKLQHDDVLAKLASIPETPLHQLRDCQLVKFRCQIQDQYDPEYFMENFEIEHVTGAKKSRTCRYREVLSCKTGERLLPQSETGSIAERSVSYCISLPGQNTWVTEAVLAQQCSTYNSCSMVTGGNSSSGISSSNKRSLEDTGDDQQNMDTDDQQLSPDDSKKARVSTTNSSCGPASGSAAAATPRFNFPIENDQGIACLVKFYKEPFQLSINDVVEVVGVVSLDPSLSAADAEDRQSDTRGPACHMPPSLVPRVHALWSRTLAHSNPLLPAVVPPTDAPQAREARELLRSILEEACLGDPLAGDYLISFLLGSVYCRQDIHVLGQYPLNLSGVKPELGDFPSKLYALLQQISSHSHLLPLNTEHLNSSSFVPKKDYSSNELCSGVLQLPRHTLLAVDETAMQAGQLHEAGLRNLEQLANVMRNQKCKYDFQFHQIELDTNINVLVMSEGKSMLPCASEVVLTPQHLDVEAAFARVDHLLTPAVLDTLRKYITAARLTDYNLSESMQKELQDEFVDMRKDDKSAITPETFHGLLVLARLVSISCGETGLNKDVWRSCKILETNREQRIAALCRPAPSLTTAVL